MRTCRNSIALILGAALFCLGRTPGPEEFLRAQMHLSPSQIADIQNGKAVATTLSSPNPSDIFVFGAVYVCARPVAYLQLMSDIGRFKKLSGYLSAGEFSKYPTIGDMDGLALDHDDIEDLKNCRRGNCELQLPEESMEAARDSIDWNSPEVAEQVNNLAKRRIVQLLEDYQHNGDQALGIYRDKRDPLPVADQSRSLLSRVELFPQYLSELNRYLLEYPCSEPARTIPTGRVNQAAGASPKNSTAHPQLMQRIGRSSPRASHCCGEYSRCCVSSCQGHFGLRQMYWYAMIGPPALLRFPGAFARPSYAFAIKAHSA